MTPFHIDPFEAGERPTGNLFTSLGFGVQEPIGSDPPHRFVASPNPRVSTCVRCGRPESHPIHLNAAA